MYCVQCGETVIGVGTVYSAVRMLSVCVHFSETVIGMCTVHSAVILLSVCVQCTVE